MRTTQAESARRSPSEARHSRRPWEVARWGRLLAGLSTLACTTLGLLHHPLWLYGTVTISVILVGTSLTDKCALRDLLFRLGAKEREDLFFPGGAPRPEVRAEESPAFVQAAERKIFLSAGWIPRNSRASASGVGRPPGWPDTIE